jgi:osmotically-inducible protein OsmY
MHARSSKLLEPGSLLLGAALGLVAYRYLSRGRKFERAAGSIGAGTGYLEPPIERETQEQSAAATGTAQPEPEAPAAVLQTDTANTADDRLLAERVRAQIRRPLSDPDAVEVRAREGRITLRGAVPATELEALLERIADVRGVQSIDNQLEVGRDSEKAMRSMDSDGAATHGIG